MRTSIPTITTTTTSQSLPLNWPSFHSLCCTQVSGTGGGNGREGGPLAPLLSSLFCFVLLCSFRTIWDFPLDWPCVDFSSRRRALLLALGRGFGSRPLAFSSRLMATAAAAPASGRGKTSARLAMDEPIISGLPSLVYLPLIPTSSPGPRQQQEVLSVWCALSGSLTSVWGWPRPSPLAGEEEDARKKAFPLCAWGPSWFLSWHCSASLPGFFS